MWDNIDFFMIQPNHFDEVINHLKHNFFYDEPLNRAVGLCREKGQSNPELEKHSLTTLKNGLSVGVKNSSGNIIGVCLNGFLYPGDIEKAKEDLKSCYDEKFRKIFNLLYEQNLKVDLFQMLNVDRIFEYRILSVDNSYRGMGYAKMLIKKSEDIARKYHCKVVKGDATNIASLKICLDCGLKAVSEINYKDTDIAVEKPHEKLSILYKVLENID